MAAAALILVLTGRTFSTIAYEVELERAQEAVLHREKAVRERFRIDQYPRYDVSQEHGLIVFSDAGISKVVAEVQYAGSYSATSKTWLWAWANDTILPHVARDSIRTRDFGRTRRFPRLTDPKWPATESDGWDMTNFQAHLTHADMTYRVPFGQGWTYLTLKNVRWARAGERYPFVGGK